MKITRRMMGIALAAVTAVGLSQPTFAASTSQTLGAESVIETIKKRGVIKIGLDFFVPWSMRDKNGDIIGFEPEVAPERGPVDGLFRLRVAFPETKS